MANWQPRFDRTTDLAEINLVLSPGRVATTSIYRWLNLAGVKTFKSHMTNRYALHDRIDERKQNGGTPPAHLEGAYRVFEESIGRADPVRIVLPLRDPLSRNLSAFRRFLSSGRVKPPETFTEGDIRALFEREVPFDRLDTWMTRNLDRLVNRADLEGRITEATPTAVFDRGRFRFLLMRSEIPDSRKAAALSEFFGARIVPDENEETALDHDSRISPDLLDVLGRLPAIISADYRARLADSDYARLFYPEAASSRWLE